MHASSLENMQKCYERHVCGDWLADRARARVVDIGGADVNGSYRDVFSAEAFDYIAVDLESGPGVQIVLDDPYELPFDDGSVDLVISGQVFEHAEFFWQLFREMGRVLAPEGLILLIAPSAGPIHRYPVDCYRFYPDAFVALARYAGLQVADLWLDERGPWKDLVGVFSKTACSPAEPDEILRRITSGDAANTFSRSSAPVPVAVEAVADEVEVMRGEISYLDVLESIHHLLEPRFYLEIGVRRGASLGRASCPSLGVDPQPDPAALELQHAEVLVEPSDFFFEFHADQALAGRPLDLALIDGMHLFEFALRDFMNIERRAHAGTVVVVDDVYPNHPLQASRDRRSRVWTGDVWKLYDCLRIHRPDLRLLPLDAGPTGLLLISGLNPSNRTLWESYNPLVRTFRDKDLATEAAWILERQGAREGDHPALGEFLAACRAARP